MTHSSSVFRKAVIPVAGFGTRMLPLTKALPKELMPICGKPIIQYAVEEAAASGIEEVILITRPQNTLVEDYFRPDPDLEQFLLQRGQEQELQVVRSLSSLIRITTLRQPEPSGLGDAVRRARPLIGNEPFAVILPDAVIDAPCPVLAQLIGAYNRYPGCFVGTQPVTAAEVSRFGMLALAPAGGPSDRERLFRISTLVEKPQPAEAPSCYGVFGRYLLGPEIFDDLEAATADCNGEVQLTPALARCCQRIPFYALYFEGTHFDAGNKVGYLQVILHFALKDPELASGLRSYLTTLTVN